MECTFLKAVSMCVSENWLSVKECEESGHAVTQFYTPLKSCRYVVGIFSENKSEMNMQD